MTLAWAPTLKARAIAYLNQAEWLKNPCEFNSEGWHQWHEGFLAGAEGTPPSDSWSPAKLEGHEAGEKWKQEVSA